MSRATSTTIRATTVTNTRTTTRKPSSSERREPSSRAGRGALAVLALVAWALFVFALRDRWAVAVFIAGALVFAAFHRPRFSRSHGALDAALLGCLAFGAAQLVPVPPAIRFALSPASLTVDRALLLTPPADPSQGPWHALSVDPEATAWAMALATSVMLLFWCTRAMFERRGGLRLTTRGIVWIGLVLSVVTFVQHYESPQLFYGIWPVRARTTVPTPFGPFVNRNDLATWLVLAIPLAAGYLMARVNSSAGPDGFTAARVEEVFDSRMAAVIAALGLMMAMLFVTTSRSGIVGCAAGLLALLAFGRRRVSTGQFLGLLVGLLLIGAAATAYVSLPMLTARFGSVFADDMGRGRLVIWRQTWPLARDFWQTGLGVGAFERGMIVYEPRPFTLFINQAHDEYLQLLVEGGVPLAALAIVAILAGWREAMRRLAGDRTSVGWMRAGAVGGMVAVGVQSIWDTGLRMPANAVLFAVLAAVAVHSGSRGNSSQQPEHA